MPSEPWVRLSFAAVASVAIAGAACSPKAKPSKPDASAAAIPSATPSDAGAEDAAVDAGPADPHEVDPMALHYETVDELKKLLPMDKETDLRFIDMTLGVGAPNRVNQGNKALAKHFISHQKCMDGLKDIVLQTDEQKRICGADNMVPIYKHGKMEKARVCIDIFEFPDVPCELPFVWVSPTQAKTFCESQGKRLCAQEEWVQACAGDPEGGKPWKYSYGNELDLEVCNTNKSAVTYGPGCEPESAKSAWKTCATNTEPSGSFPKCRSRFGVFDMQGNVAESMARYDVDEEKLMDQLKGSAFFYVDVARDENGKPPPGHRKPTDEDAAREWGRRTYPDICAHDPRWHVEPLNDAWHVNYHLGSRCCKTLRREKSDKDKGEKKGQKHDEKDDE